MDIIELNEKPVIEQNKKLHKRFSIFKKLIAELKKKEIPPEIVKSINKQIEELNAFSGLDKALLKQMRKSVGGILRLIEKELKLVPKNLYRNRWMAIGMSGFGVPIGIAFGVSLDNMGLLAIGIGVGLAIGIVVGAGMDKKAFTEGRQLDVEIGW